MKYVRDLRIDAVPSDAFIVPWMRPSPSIEELKPQLPYSPPPFDIDAVMSDALKLNVTFTIETPNGTRVVPSTIYMGYDLDYLYIGGKFVGMGINPFNTDEVTVPQFLQILLDVADDGVLTTPESGSILNAYVDRERVSLFMYSDMLWAYESWCDRPIWAMSDIYYMEHDKPLPGFSIGDMNAAYDGSTGTLSLIWSKFLRLPVNAELNELQMRRGERWVMGFLVEMGYWGNTTAFQDYVDGWPKKAYPYLSNNCSWWPKLVIDLTNPPPAFSTGPTGSDVVSQHGP